MSSIRYTVHSDEENIINSPRYRVEIFEIFENISTHENITPYSVLNYIFDEQLIRRPVTLDITSQKYVNIINKDCKECSICYEDFNNESSVSLLNCGHYFHTKCIKKWGNRNNTCPVCRKEIPLIE